MLTECRENASARGLRSALASHGLVHGVAATTSPGQNSVCMFALRPFATQSYSSLSGVDHHRLVSAQLPARQVPQSLPVWWLNDSTTRRYAIIAVVNNTHRKTLERIFSEPVNGNIEWARIEAMLEATGCRVVEGAGSSVTFEFNGRKMTLHRPHPGKEALRYRVLAVREFVERMGIKP